MEHICVSLEKAKSLKKEFEFLQSPEYYVSNKLPVQWVKLLVLPINDNNKDRFYAHYLPEHMFSERDIFETPGYSDYTILVATAKIPPYTTQVNPIIQRFGFIEYLKVKKVPFKLEELVGCK